MCEGCEKQSVCINQRRKYISEGAILQSNPEQKKFISYAIRSLAEVVTCLHKSKRRKYIAEAEFEKHYNEAFHLMNMMIAFRNKID